MAVSGVVLRKVLPACGELCYLCPSLRARSKQLVKRYKKILADIFPATQITSYLEQRCYKELRNEQYGFAKIVVLIYRKLLVSCLDLILTNKRRGLPHAAGRSRTAYESLAHPQRRLSPSNRPHPKHRLPSPRLATPKIREAARLLSHLVIATAAFTSQKYLFPSSTSSNAESSLWPRAMGGSQSRSISRDGSGHGWYGHSYSFQQPSAQQWGAGGYPYDQDPQGGYYAPLQQGGYAAPYPAYQPSGRAGGASKPRLDRRYSQIADDYHSVDQVTVALAQAGLESSNLIAGIDFTKSNE